ncbi:MAG: tetratricopeptide repeat protein, partial [Planctomycetaceae bacterium]|nr:tetratricopeptide repeat protein [Planctomycetaceae bacterium]
AQPKTDNEAARRQYAAAAALQNASQFELAGDEWSKFLKDYAKDPLAPYARHYLGLCQLKANQHAAAVQTLEPLAGESTKFEMLEPTLLYLGLSQFNVGQKGDAKQFERATATFNDQLKKFPTGNHAAQAMYYLAEVAYAQGKKDQAVAAYQQVAQKFPDDALTPDALYAAGVTFEELGKPESAGPVYDQFLAKFGSHGLATEVGMRRGDTLLAAGKLDEAEKRFAAAAGVSNFTLADHALMRQATVRYQQQKYPDAAALYASLPQKFPMSRYIAAAQLAAGKCAYLAGDYDQARKLLDAIKNQKDDAGAEAGHWIVRSLLKQQKLDEAAKTVEALVKQHTKGPWVAQLALDRADVLFEQPQRQKDAIAAYLAIAKDFANDPLAPQALYLAAFAALQSGDYAGAIKHTETFLKDHAKHEKAADVRYVAAESYLQQAQYDKAEQRYAELLAQSPQHADVPLWHVRRGLCSYLKQDYSKALATLQPVVATLPTAAWKAEALYMIGACQLEQQKTDEAIKSLRASLAADGAWRQADETRLTLAQALRQANQIDAARQELTQLLKDYPQSAARDRAQYRLAELAFAKDDFATAAKDYRQVLDQYASSRLVPHALYGLGWSQFRSGDAAGALKSLNDLLSKHAQHEVAGQARYLRALVHQELKQPDQAIEDLDSYLKSKPSGTELSNARYALGLAQSSAKKFKDAVKTFEQLLKDDGKYADADKVYYELAWSQRGLDKQDEATESFLKLAKSYPQSPLACEALYHVGDRRYEKQQWKEAAQAYYDSMTLAKEGPLGEKAAHKLGWAYFQQNSYSDAEQTFTYQKQTWPQGELAADGQFMAAESLFKQNKYPEALAAFQQVKNPPRKELALLALLHAAQSASALQDWKQSLALATQAAAVDATSPYQAEILYEQGWALQNQGKADEALKIFEDVTAKSDAEVAARARFLIGEIYFERKDHKEAIRNFFKAAVYNYPQWQAAAHYEAGRCFEVLKDANQARKSYEEVIEKFPMSDRAGEAKKRLEALGK